MDVRTTSPSPVPHTEFFPPPREPRGPSVWLAKIRQDRRELIQFWPVIQNMVVQDLRVRYQRSFFGFLWTLLNPILMMATLTVVFPILFQQQREHYIVILFAGMVPWNFMSGCLNDCAFAIIHNEGLIRKIYLPKLVFPLTRVLINLTTFVFSFVSLFLIMLPIGARVSLPMLLLPVVILLFTAFALGLGLILATANTFFRDCGHLVSVVLQAWYFATPIIYDMSRFSAQTQRWFWLNPAFPFIRLFQVILYDGLWPSRVLFLAATGIASVSLGVGYVAFKSHEDKLVFRL
ncbi:ABC transporter permease [Singulisphaera sp. PoT]|uniref:ABC transporter permease n=1 Tax=Singulisphaera sp. PoT TaxID=3411797 RepID=UPI003BF50DD2